MGVTILHPTPNPFLDALRNILPNFGSLAGRFKLAGSQILKRANSIKQKWNMAQL